MPGIRLKYGQQQQQEDTQTHMNQNESTSLEMNMVYIQAADSISYSQGQRLKFAKKNLEKMGPKSSLPKKTEAKRLSR